MMAIKMLNEVLTLLFYANIAQGFVSISTSNSFGRPTLKEVPTKNGVLLQLDLAGFNLFAPSKPAQKFDASEIVKDLVATKQCYTTTSGAKEFVKTCAEDIVYEDCYSAKEPYVGAKAVEELMLSKISERKGNGEVRVDRISDGTIACGFAWTFTCGDKEGLRGTTFVDFNKDGKISYVREIPEPIFKPGDLTVKLLEAVTKGATPKPPVEYKPRKPNTASEIAKYLFNEVQGSSIEESLKLFDESIVYRDFNYQDVFRGKEQVKNFIEEFNFPGITFKTDRFDDGRLSTAFTWEVVLDGIEDTTKGISFYELNPETKLVNYVRDVPESAIKPAPLGKLARQLRPGVGVFDPVPLGSRDGGK